VYRYITWKEEIRGPGGFTIQDQAWQIVGGGKFDATGLKETLATLPEFSGYSVTVE
jgi:hypothetical protein